MPDPSLVSFWLGIIQLFSASGVYNSLYGEDWSNQLAIVASNVGVNDPLYLSQLAEVICYPVMFFPACATETGFKNIIEGMQRAWY